MSRERVYDRGMRLLAEHRLTVHHIDERTVEATVRGDSGEIRHLGFRGAWSCDCPARTTCAHLLALWAVVTRPGALASEALALGESIEKVERQAAKKRQGQPGTDRSGKLPERSKHETREAVGEAVGMSGRTYEEAKAVNKAATDLRSARSSWHGRD